MRDFKRIKRLEAEELMTHLLLCFGIDIIFGILAECSRPVSASLSKPLLLLFLVFLLENITALCQTFLVKLLNKIYTRVSVQSLGIQMCYSCRSIFIRDRY